MKKTSSAVLLLLLSATMGISTAPPAWPQSAPPSPEPAAHNELRALRDGLLEAMNKGDVERELTYLHPNVVATWHDAEVSRGRDGVRKYLQRMLGGPHPVVSSFHADVDVDELSILYAHDEVAVSWGSARETFKMADGRALVLPARWSTTLVKDGGRWQIASLHASDDLFDNPILALAKRAVYWAAGIALLVGIVLGWLLGRRRRPA